MPDGRSAADECAGRTVATLHVARPLPMKANSSLKTLSAARLSFVSQPVTEYLIDREFQQTSEVERVCQVVLGVVLSRVETAFIDAYSDVVELPDAARAAQAALFGMGRARDEGDPGMAIDLDVRNAEHVRLLHAFVAWSIGAELYDGEMRWVAYISDTADSISFNVTDEEIARIRAALSEVPIVTVKERRHRRR